MKTARARRGVTLIEMMVAMTILAVICVAFAGFLRYATKAAVLENMETDSQEAVRQGLGRMELALIHANEVTIASSTIVEFIAGIDQSPNWRPNDDDDGDGVPNYLDSDMDGDAAAVQPASATWRSGYNLTDDDENGDGKIDVRERIYLSSRTIYYDMSLDEAPWGGSRLTKLLTNVSSFTITYYGNKANQLGSAIDTNGDGIISSSEMDCDSHGGGNCNGMLDLAVEKSYITSIRLHVAVDFNKDGTNEYTIDTDVYPPLLPLKPLQR